MLWFAPRPHLKWAGAVALVGFSWWIQLTPTPMTMHPFARTDIGPGVEISDDLFEWRETPEGVLPPTNPQGTLAVVLAAGDPLHPSFLSRDEPTVPDGWWVLELEAPPGLLPGRYVLLVAGGDGLSSFDQPIPGMVIRPLTEMRDAEEMALIAVPGEHLTRVSSAAAYGTPTVAVAPNR